MEEEVEPTLVAAGASGVAHPVFNSSKASFFTSAEEELANTLVAEENKILRRGKYKWEIKYHGFKYLICICSQN